MKKLFSLVTVFLLAIGLSACTDADLNQQIADLESQLTDQQELVDDLAGWAALAAARAQEINRLEGEIDALEGQLFPIQIQVSMADFDGVFTTKYFGFNAESVPSMAALIEFAFDAVVTDSPYGHFIEGFEGYDAPYGSYVSISENNVMSSVGIDDLVINDGDHFKFQLMWWDTTQQAVYEAIQLFIDHQVENYLSTEYIDYNVLLACQELCDIPLTETNISVYVHEMTYTMVPDYFKGLMMANTLTDTTYADDIITYLNAMVTTGPYGQTGLGLLALDSKDHDVDYSAYVTSALNYYLNTSSPYDEGLDAGAYGVMALANYTDEPGVQALIDEYVQWIMDDQLPSGGINTRDIIWNDTTYPGTENAASLAQVILALVANDIDPAGEDFTQGDNNLVLRLTQFQLADGTFDWDLTDDIEGDPAFSTPQAFVALVTYYHYMNTFGEYTTPYMR